MEQVAFAAHPLPEQEPWLSGDTQRQVARAWAALIAELVDLRVLAPVREGAAYDRRFHAVAVVEVLLGS